LETTLLFFGFIVWNDFGSPATVLSVLGGFFGVVKRSLSRVLIQLVCLGYGVGLTLLLKLSYALTYTYMRYGY
jgi:hypothetical protein